MRKLRTAFVTILVLALAGCESAKLSPNSSHDLVLSAFFLDVSRVQKLLDTGADVNARCGEYDQQPFQDYWSGGYHNPRNWTPLLAVANSIEYPPPERPYENTEARQKELDEEKKRVPQSAVEERNRLRMIIARMLLDAGADVNADDGHGETALWSSVFRYDELALLLLDHGARVDVRQQGSFCGEFPRDTTPLHWATWNTNLVQALIEKGADIHAVDSFGDTPLCYALGHRRLESAKILVKAGAKLPPPKEGRHEYLHGLVFCSEPAALDGVVEWTRFLIELGADVSWHGDFNGDTPLHEVVSGFEYALAYTEIKGARRRAAEKKDEIMGRLLSVLVEAGAEVDAQNDAEESPLFCAANTAKAKAVELLLAAGADPLLCDKNGDTPLSKAAEYLDDFGEDPAYYKELNPPLELLKEAARATPIPYK